MTITDKQINQYLNQFHINHAMSGYLFLMSAIRFQVEGTIPRGYMAGVYEMVADKHDTKPSYVENAIRDVLKRSDAKMSNKQFIVTAMDELVFGSEEPETGTGRA